MRRFVRYERKSRDGVIRVLQGQQNGHDKDGRAMIRTDEGHVVSVPPEYRRVGVSRQWLAMTHCLPPVNEARLLAAGALAFDTWLDRVPSGDKTWLTLRDVLRCVVARSPSRPMWLYSFNRNAGDRSADESVNKRGHALSPVRFFRMLRCKVIFQQQGRGLFMEMNFVNEPDAGPFTVPLEVEYRPGCWYPLDEHGTLLLPRAHWTNMRPDTRVGMRGGLMQPSMLRQLPKVYFV